MKRTVGIAIFSMVFICGVSFNLSIVANDVMLNYIQELIGISTGTVLYSGGWVFLMHFLRRKEDDNKN